MTPAIAVLLIIVGVLATIAAFEWIRANGAEEHRDEWRDRALEYQRQLAQSRSDAEDYRLQFEAALPLPKAPA